MAFCSKCGSKVDSNARFCPACGAPVGQAQQGGYQPTYQQTDYQPTYQQTDYQPTYQPPGYQQNGYQPMYQTDAQSQYGQPYAPVQQRTYPLKWHMFLTRFALWVTALLQVVSAVNYFTGSVYETNGGSSMLVYAYFGNGLKTVDTLYACFCLAMAVYIIWTCLCLIKFKRKAPEKLYIFYFANLIVGLLYLFLVWIITGVSMGAGYTVGVIGGTLIGFAINYTYYKKRESLFRA